MAKDLVCARNVIMDEHTTCRPPQMLFLLTGYKRLAPLKLHCDRNINCFILHAVHLTIVSYDMLRDDRTVEQLWKQKNIWRMFAVWRRTVNGLACSSACTMTRKPSSAAHMSAVMPWSSRSSRSTPSVSTSASAASTLPHLHAWSNAVHDCSSAAFNCGRHVSANS